MLYTDINLTNIQIGQKILADNSNANYTFCDVTNLNTSNQSVVAQILEMTKRLGIVLVSISAFVQDETLAETLDKLYDWAPVDSFLALDFDSRNLAGRSINQ